MFRCFQCHFDSCISCWYGECMALYPQATPLGDPIPLEIVRPLSLIKCDFSDTVASGIVMPAAADFLILRATAMCYVRIGAGALALPLVHGTDYPGVVIVDAGEILVIDHNGAATFSVIRATVDSGVLHVQTVVKYTDVRKISQVERA